MTTKDKNSFKKCNKFGSQMLSAINVVRRSYETNLLICWTKSKFTYICISIKHKIRQIPESSRSVSYENRFAK